MDLLERKIEIGRCIDRIFLECLGLIMYIIAKKFYRIKKLRVRLMKERKELAFFESRWFSLNEGYIGWFSEKPLINNYVKVLSSPGAPPCGERDGWQLSAEWRAIKRSCSISAAK